MSDMEKDKAASAVKGARDLCNAILDAKTREERRLLNTERYARLAPEIPADAVVKCVLSKAYSSGPPPDALFKRLLTELGEKGRVDLVIAALRWLLESHGVPQAPDVFIGALSVCCSNFNPKLAQWVFSLMQQHGVPQPLLSYNLLLTAYSNAGLVDEAFEAYSLMRQKGVMPNTFTFLTIIQGCNFKRMGRYDRAVAAFQDMQQAVLHPPAVVKMALLQVCEAAMDKSESWQQAMKVFLVLQQLELENRTIVFNALLRACARVGAWQKALDIFEHMRRIWVEADTGTYNAMLKACVQGGEVDKAFEVYEWMVEGRGGSDAGVKADTETYNILIQGCHRRGMLEKALEAMAWMQGCGVEFDPQTYAELEDTLDISRLWDEKVQNTEEPSDGSAAVLLPDMLRSGPFDGMRMAYLQDQVQLLEDRILSVARCGGRSSWVPATMLPGPHADFVAAAEQQAVVDQVAAIFPPLGGVRAPAVRCVPNHSVLRALGPSIKAPSALLAKSTGYSMQGTWDWALRSKRNPTTEPRLR